MAVVKRLADVFPKHRLSVFIWFGVSVVVIGTALLMLMHIVGVDYLTATLVTGTIMILLSLCSVMLVSYALEPLDYLSRVITHASGQPNDVILPNLNGTRHEANGYKQMIDVVYDISLGSSNKPSKKTMPFAEKLFAVLPCGVVALDASRKIVYSNQAAPIVTTDRSTHLQLTFDGTDDINSWLESVEKQSIEAEKFWPRVQNVPEGTDKKIFDVVASYRKNAEDGFETIIITIDRTAEYVIDQEGMDFIAMAAHELRGPVTVIHGYLEILRRDLKLSAQQNALFDRLEVSANRLSGYVGNILNAAKYDRRHLKLHLHEDSLARIYSLIADDIELRAKTQNRTLSVNIPEDLPKIAADKTSLSEVMANFIDNAIKYSNEGGAITVIAKDEKDMVRVDVIDNGSGIPAAVVGNLFTKFYRSHRTKHTTAGTGLGLYISKAIIESHGGKVGVKSREGEGSTFTFWLPTYESVKDKLLASAGQNQGIIETSGGGWIKNHASYRG